MTDIKKIVNEQIELHNKTSSLVNTAGTVIVVGAMIIGVSLLIKGLKGKEIK